MIVDGPLRRGQISPRWVPAHEQIENIRLYARAGLTQEQIDTIFGKSADTLQRHSEIRTAMDTGRLEAVGKVAETRYQVALDGNVPAMIFYLKTQGRWSEKTEPQEHQHSGGLHLDHARDAAEAFADRIALLAARIGAEGAASDD
jgi:hypothetical protein